MGTIDRPTNARSRRTREALLAATREILESDGFAGLTMTAVAERAGVTRRAAYLHFASRAALVDALFAYVADREGLEQSAARVWAAPDAVGALRAWAAHYADYHFRVLAVDRAVSRVERKDPDAAAHRARVRGAKLANCRRIAQWLADEDVLAPAWTVDTAAQMLSALTNSDLIESLMIDCGWSATDFTNRIAELLIATFTVPARESTNTER